MSTRDNRSDEELACLSASGSSSAFAQLVERYEGRCYRFARRFGLSPQEAEDAVQDAFLAAWKSLGRYDPRRPFGTWLMTIQARRASSLVRARSARLRHERAYRSDETVSTPADGDESGGLWSRIMERLGVDASTMLWLRYVEDLTPTQIARVLGMSAGAVRVRLHRIRKRLIAEFGHELLDDAPVEYDAGAQLAECGS